MTNRSLNAQADDTVAQLHSLEQAHLEAQAYDLACERMVYLHERLSTLYLELMMLAFAAEVLQQIYEDGSGQISLRYVRDKLRQSAPPDLESPGGALVAGKIELLRLVEYTGAAIALARERRLRLCEQLAYRISLGEQVERRVDELREIVGDVLGGETCALLEFLNGEGSVEARLLIGLVEAGCDQCGMYA